MLRVRKIVNNWAFECLVGLGAILLTLMSPKWWLVDNGSDDLLYVRQALSIKSGDWLGSFSDGGGLKLPGFQIYLALISYTRIPFYVGVILIQIVAALLVRNYFKKVFQKEFIYRVIFVFCVINPALFGANNARVIRDGFYSSLLTLLFGLSLNLFLILRTFEKVNKTKTLISIFFFALVSTWIAFTREETLLFVFFLIFLILAIALLNNFNKAGFRNAAVLTLFVASVLCGSGIVLQQTNERYYGNPSSALIQSGPLIELVNQWSRVMPVSSNSRVLVSKEQRDLIYRNISIIGAKEYNLENYLNWYIGPSCGMAGICDDIGSGWTFWGFFYGLTIGEGLNNPKDFNVLVKQMTEEINYYCESNARVCDTSMRLPTIGNIRNFLPILKAMPVEFMRSLLQRGNFDPIQPSSGSLQNMNYFKLLIPIGGPPDVWPVRPLGNPDTAFISILICLLMAITFLARKDGKHEIISENIIGTMAPFALLMILIMFRISTTGIVSVVGWNVDRSSYELPNNVLLWILIGLFVSLSSGHLRKVNSIQKIFKK